VAKKTLTLEDRLTIKFSHQAGSTHQQNPRLHPQKSRTKQAEHRNQATQQAKAGKSKERQAVSRPPKTSIHEVPKSIFSFPKDTAWAFTVSATPCNDKGIARAIRRHAGVKNRDNSYLGELDFFSKNGPTNNRQSP